MAKPSKTTSATRWLWQQELPIREHCYDYVDRGGAGEAARQLGIAPEQVIKTLVMVRDGSQPFLVLMHGDREVSTKRLAREIGAKSVQASRPDQAQKVTGYQVGGLSPFGTRQELAVYVEASIGELDRVWVNGGRRGLLVELERAEWAAALEALKALAVSCAQPG